MSEPHDFRKVEELYHAALARGPDQRDVFLKEACGGDERLLHEVKSLLGYEEEAKRLLEEPAGVAETRRLAVVRGTRLGPYEVSHLIGAGGMGEVYRARDTRLGRDVAVKVLPEHVAKDPETLARFAREARAVAALSHPHICALHDVGEEGDVHYLVMELLEGETLAVRLERGALPLDEVLSRAIEIAEALGAAHAQGIVHRDLKPGNVMLTRTGAKLLDFGLAKLRPVEGVSERSGERTFTRENVVAGTPGYMAPEQLERGVADTRTDVFALGAVIYEMATGERAFTGTSPASLIASIVKSEVPSLSSRRPGTPAALDRLVGRCLRKDATERWQSAQDVALRLREIAETGPESEGRRPVRSSLRWTIATMALVAITALLAGVFAYRQWQREPDLLVVRSEIALTQETALSPHPELTTLALSPDGTYLVWSGASGGDPHLVALYLRRLDSDEVKRIPGTEGAEQPFFSPDGRWIAFFTRDRTKLRKVPVGGGLVLDLADTELSMGASWAADGRIFLGTVGRGIHWVSSEGGSPREITSVDRTREVGHRLPVALPGGRVLLSTTMPHFWGLRARIEAFSLTSGVRKIVVEDGADAHYLSTGHLLFVRQGVLMAAPFDLARLELTPPPVPVVKSVSHALDTGDSSSNSGAAQFAVSDAGLLVYASGGIFEFPPVEMVLLDEAGRSEPLPGFDKPLVSPQGRFSPDGSQYAFVEQARSGLVWLFDVQRHTSRALSEAGIAGCPVWSPDGARLAVSWSKGGPLSLWTLPAQGGGDWQRLTDSEIGDWASSWSPDGRFLAFSRSGVPPRGDDILLYRFEDRQVVPFLTTKADEWGPEFSPDGRWLAYVSNESGRPEVYVTSFPDRKEKLTVSLGGRAPAWSRDGRTLFYHSLLAPDGPSTMMAVAVRLGASLSLGKPTTLFRLPDSFRPMNPMRNIDLHPDGRRFLFGIRVKRDPPPPITRLHVVQNWFTELERLSPTPR